MSYKLDQALKVEGEWNQGSRVGVTTLTDARFTEAPPVLNPPLPG